MKNGEKLFEGIGYIDDTWFHLLDEPVSSYCKSKEKIGCFVGYELKKLFRVKFLWGFLFVLLMLNSAMAWYTAEKTIAAGEPTQMISEFFDAYFENPSEFDAHYDEINAFYAEQERLFRETMQVGDDLFEMETMPNRYSTDEAYSDRQLFQKLYSTINAARAYPEVLEQVIHRAKTNLEAFQEMGVTEDSFTYQYQLRVIALYEKMRDSVDINIEYTRGWDEYFSYDTVNIFIFMMLILLGSLIFTSEKQSGFLPIIRTAKHGRARTAAAKILTMLLLTGVFVLMFTFSTFAVYGLRIGYSSSNNVIQALPAFTLSPYQITIGQYFGIAIFVKLLSFTLFSMIIIMLSVIFYQYVLIYFAGLSVFGLNFLFYKWNYLDSNSICKNLNLVTAAAGNPLFVRYRAMNVFGAVAGFVPSMAILFPVLIAVCIAATVFLYTKGTSGIHLHHSSCLDAVSSFCMTKLAALRYALMEILKKRMHKKRPSRYICSYHHSLVWTEVFKTLISSRLWVIVLLILCVKSWYSINTNRPSDSYADAVYKEYMIVLEGEVTDEKLAYLETERTMIDKTLDRQTTMQKAYVNEEVTFDEYREYLSDYNYAYSRTELLSMIEKHAAYLQQKEAETGIKGWFFYDTGWQRLYAADADLFLYASILLLLTGSFAAEYASKSSSGGFAQLLRSTKNGRQKTFHAKLISAGMITVVLALSTGVIDLVTILFGYRLPAMDAPLFSMQMFAEVSGGITVIQYFVLFFVMRMAGALLMAMLVCALSELLARYLPVLGTTVMVTLLPALCVSFGFTAAEPVNFLNLFAGTPLFLQSAKAAMFGNGYSMLLLWLVIAVMAVVAMMMPAKRMFVK
ncbi:MAG: hypothetical protein J6I50_09735 [Clostridia bacterium]|nr:hypothetical protein [Clostridia bacterium]